MCLGELGYRLEDLSEFSETDIKHALYIRRVNRFQDRQLSGHIGKLLISLLADKKSSLNQVFKDIDKLIGNPPNEMYKKDEPDYWTEEELLRTQLLTGAGGRRVPM